MDTILWEFNEFQIVEDEDTGHLKVVNNDSGWVDWPICYGIENGLAHVAYDAPERIPRWVKNAVTVLYHTEQSAQARQTRLQLCEIKAYMSEMERNDKKHRDCYNVGSLPYYVEAYTREHWEQCSLSIKAIYGQFLTKVRIYQPALYKEACAKRKEWGYFF